MDPDTDKEKMVVGVKQTLRMIEQRGVSKVYVADDADFYVVRGVVDAAGAAGIPVVSVPSKKKLGRRCGIEKDAAAAGVLV